MTAAAAGCRAASARPSARTAASCVPYPAVGVERPTAERAAMARRAASPTNAASSVAVEVVAAALVEAAVVGAGGGEATHGGTAVSVAAAATAAASAEIAAPSRRTAAVCCRCDGAADRDSTASAVRRSRYAPGLALELPREPRGGGDCDAFATTRRHVSSTAAASPGKSGAAADVATADAPFIAARGEAGAAEGERRAFAGEADGAAVAIGERKGGAVARRELGTSVRAAADETTDESAKQRSVLVDVAIKGRDQDAKVPESEEHVVTCHTKFEKK